ncbi:MAG: hypothetical protein Q8K26_00480 [Candidatus Gracilibacteria bacterium]|nr:hypothetical protein [Candidatus Gracilibacteria bacterium]
MFEFLTVKDIVSISLAFLYAYLYLFTIKKILQDYHNVSTISFAGFAFTNLGLGISNGFHIGSLGYFTAFLMGSITVMVNEMVKGKISRGEVTPKINNHGSK